MQHVNVASTQLDMGESRGLGRPGHVCCVELTPTSLLPQTHSHLCFTASVGAKATTRKVGQTLSAVFHLLCSGTGTEVEADCAVFRSTSMRWPRCSGTKSILVESSQKE